MNALPRWPPPMLALPAVGAIAVWLYVAWHQIVFPLELFGHEGAIVDHIRRVLDGKPIYGPPEIEFVPFLYTPGFYLISAAFAWAGDIAFVVPRSISAAATVASMGCLVWLTHRLTGGWIWGVLAAGAFALGVSQVHAWYALAQVDNLFLLMLVLGVLVAHVASGGRGFFIAGLLFTAAFWCKQVALGSGLIYAGVLLFINGRHALALILGLTIGVLPLVLYLSIATDGWFLYYAFEIPASFGVELRPFLTFIVIDLPWLLPAFALALFVLWQLWRSGQKDQALRLLALGLCLLGTAVLGRAHPGGHVNTLLPAIWLMALSLGASAGRLWEARVHVAKRFPTAMLVVVVSLGQLALLVYDPGRFLPSKNGAAARTKLATTLSALPQPLLLPGAGYLVGRVAGADHVAVNDVLRTDRELRDRFLASLDRAMREKRYKSVVVEEYLVHRHAWLYEPYYRAVGPLAVDVEPQRPRTGFDYGRLWLLEAK